MRKTLAGAVKYTVIGILSLLILVPLWDMLINSFKTAQESASPNISLPREWQLLENYSKVIEKGKVFQGFKNSLIITVSSVVTTLVVSTGASFVFGRRKERWIRMVFYVFLIGIMTPPSMIITTMMLKTMGLLGTYLGMILFYTALFSPLPIFLLTGYMNTIPLEIEESATMDGATPRHLFQRIVLPMMRPAIATGFIYIFLKVWNDFLSPVYLLAGNTKKYTIIMSLYFFMGQFYTQWNYVFAFLTLVSIPVIIVFIFAQRQIAEGMTAGALKG